MPRPTYPPPLPPPISTTCPPADTTAAPLLAASPLALYSVPPYNGPEPALAPYDPNAGSRGFGRGRSAKKRQKQEPVEDDDDALPAEDQNMPSKKVKKGPQAKKECKKPKTDGPSLSVRRLKATLSKQSAFEKVGKSRKGHSHVQRHQYRHTTDYDGESEAEMPLKLGGEVSKAGADTVP